VREIFVLTMMAIEVEVPVTGKPQVGGREAA
jgi:hypothetical protein